MPKTKSYKNTETQTLVQMLGREAGLQGLATERADPKAANAAYRQMVRLYRELRSRGLSAQRELLSLLHDENANVRASAAYFALEFDPQSAEPVLERIDREERNLCGLTAQMVLKQWRKGELKFPD